MKNITIVILLLTIFLNSKGQKKGDNTIVIDTFRTIKEIKQILFNKGFTIDGTDTSFFVTTPKQMKTASVVRFMIARTDTSIAIQGQAKIQVEIMGIKNDFQAVEYRVSKQNLNYEWFGEMDRVAKLLGNKIHYLKQ